MSWFTGGTNHTESWRTEEVIRQVEVRVIEEVEKFCAKLEVYTLTQSSVLHERGIDVLITRSVDDILAGIAECSGGGKRKSRRVEPARRGWIAEFRVCNHIRTIV